jgi:hypothetical protein
VSDDEPICPLCFIFDYDETGKVGCSVTAPSFASVIGCYPELQHAHLSGVWWEDFPLWDADDEEKPDPNHEPWDDDMIGEVPEPAVVQRHEWKFS